MGGLGGLEEGEEEEREEEDCLLQVVKRQDYSSHVWYLDETQGPRVG